jgi:hypothetical protein
MQQLRGEFCKRIVPMKIVATIQITDHKKPMVSPILRDRYNSKRKNGIAKNMG